MKKLSFLLLLICIVLCCSLFTACSQVPTNDLNEYNQSTSEDMINTIEPMAESTDISEEGFLSAFIVEMESDSLMTGLDLAEYDFWSDDCTQPYQEESASKKVTITFAGGSYTGDYNCSRILLPNTYRSDYYRFAEGEFAINAETGKVVFWGVPDAQEGEMTAEECKEIANAFVSPFLDLDQYSLTVRPGNYVHNYTYTKYVSDMPTADKCNVGVTTAGKVVLFDSTMLGAFSSNVLRADAEVEQNFGLLSSDQAEAVLVDKVQTVCSDLSNIAQYEKSTFSYEIKHSQLVLLPDNSVGMLHKVVITIRTPFEEGKYLGHSTSMRILVKCE